MYILYNFIAVIASVILKGLALVNTKLSLFVNGRKNSLSIIEKSISKEDKVIWIHAASLGEFEQGLPVLEQLKLSYPHYKTLLTFFSPSGYEVKKNSKVADVICYLPLDTKNNVKSFIKMAHPDIAIFIKYEIWPNYLAALKNLNTPTFLISALFKKKQSYFKWYGHFMRKALKNFTHIFVQNSMSSDLLKSIGLKNVTVAGDTRFDRVLEITKRNNDLEFMKLFKDEQFCFVAGSTWSEDERLLIDYINQSKYAIKYVIAPHTMKADHIKNIVSSIDKSVICYSDLNEKVVLKDYDVIIIDTIGLLTKIYSYADIAYVGGGFATGLHNTLEPAVFEIPVIIGEKYEGFAEAEELVTLVGIISVNSFLELKKQVDEFFNDNDKRELTGQINSKYIKEKAGATPCILNELNSVLATKN
ncbi:3-deoxy-D-manno-octulosonic acid transferase [Maribacter sp. 6B07]|uniref:3-deoxy-D-manno-octulosonic acid transferase n=1 Tax=Maribacter sp. 6B07 TaxID=2045442 RepID=UPI000C081CAA|nr:glycosyltransferase N-terminal domain-containing protein [Maribacter sp. 6B07]PHN94487.1 3-deoxy-D-manno-octulosonic acid transferase [Maribacter sp. 6B07]